MRKIKITTTRTYTKTAEVEIDCPEFMALDEVEDFLHDNEDLYRNELEEKLADARLEYDFEFDQTRFDVTERVVLSKRLWVGSL